MSDKLILDFPVLQQGGGDFLKTVFYETEASQNGGKLTIKHAIKGQSFIRQLVKNGDACFSVSLLYKDRAERQNYSCKIGDITEDNSELIATQTIPMGFSYAPEITPSIIVLESKKITVDNFSGLTDFWDEGYHFEIPKYARIALGLKLKFTSGDLSCLMKLEFDKALGHGEMKVEVDESAGEGATPVALLCGKGVFDELKKVTVAKPEKVLESMRAAIVTQALCAVYAYMQNLGNEREIGGVLLAHLEMLEDKTGESWQYEGFNPSLAATKMQPYAIQALHNEADDD